MSHQVEIPGDTPGYVPVLVPTALVPEVLRFLADRYVTPTPAAPSTETPLAEAPPTEAGAGTTDVWPIEKLAKFSASRVKTVVIVSEVLDYLAERPDRPVPTSELSEATGRTYTGLRAAWVKLSRHLEKHYGDPTWPLTAERGPSVELPLRETYYTIAGEQAERWKQVRRQGPANPSPT